MIYLNYEPELSKGCSNLASAWQYGLGGFRAAGPVAPDAVVFDTFVERTFVWGDDKATHFEHTRPWVGVVHNPSNVGQQVYRKHTPEMLSLTNRFQKSMRHCLGIIVLSHHLKDHLRTIPVFDGVPISVVLHPIADPGTRWSLAAWQAGTRKVVQIGYWLRRKTSIYRLPTLPGMRKCILPFDRRMESELRGEDTRGLDLSEENVQRVPPLPAAEYDALLCDSVVFLDFYDASANNTVLECLVRRTPVLVNEGAVAVKEYLGADYPLYYSSLDEAARMLADDALLERAHEYLDTSPLPAHLSAEHFVESILSSEVYQNVLRHVKK